MCPPDLYESDFPAWSAAQAQALRRLAGLGGNSGVDWDNLIEEVESLGRSERQAVESLWLQALVHLLKLHLDPDNAAGDHWRHEIAVFLETARQHYAPSMRQPLTADLDRLWRRARHVLGSGRSVPAELALLPVTCPIPVADLLAEDTRPDDLLARLEPQP